MQTISWDDFSKVELRLKRIASAETFKGERVLLSGEVKDYMVAKIQI